MNRAKERLKAFGEAVRSKLPKNRDAEVAWLAATIKRQSREIEKFKCDMQIVDAAWQEEMATSKKKDGRIERITADLKNSRETFRQATAANEQLSDLVSTLREQNRELQAKVAAARTIKGVWDASESLLDLSRLMQDRIEKFKRDVGHAYLMDVSAKN